MNKQEKHLKKKTKNEENRSCKNEGTETKNEWQPSISRNASVMGERVTKSVNFTPNAWSLAGLQTQSFVAGSDQVQRRHFEYIKT